MNVSEQPEQSSWPDPAFKLATRRLAERLGLQSLNIEFPQTLRADLVLSVPADISVEGTLFSFFRRYNVLEFKGQDDPLTEVEFVKNQVRAELLFIEIRDRGEEVAPEDILNVIVSSRKPENFLQYAAARGYELQPERDALWLHTGWFGFHPVAIVVCRELPLAPDFYDWLVFAPARSIKWRELFRIALAQRLDDVLHAMRKLRPKEFEMTHQEFERLFNELTPREQDRMDKDEAIATRMYLKRMSRRKPALVTEILATIEPEMRLAGMDAEERLAGLKPEERVAGLSQEEREKLMKFLAEQLASDEEKKPE